MFETYKNLIGKKTEGKKYSSIMDQCFSFLLSPYKKMFKELNEQPKAKVNNQEAKIVVKPLFKPKTGKILWKKK